jgi:hypothetical protein
MDEKSEEQRAKMLGRPSVCLNVNPQPNPQNAMSCTTSAYYGSPRGLFKSL